MKTTSIKLMISSAIAALAIASSAPTTEAAQVTYYTDGEFAGGSKSVSSGGITVTFLDQGTVGSPAGPFNPPTGADFGTFIVSGTPGSGISGSIGFTLDIFQVLPGLGTGTFVGQASGFINFGGPTDASVQFASPLQFSIVTGDVTTTYRITEADIDPNTGQPVPGRVNLESPSASGDGESTIEGLITQTVVPEPGTVAMAVTGLPLLGFSVLRYRRRQKQA